MKDLSVILCGVILKKLIIGNYHQEEQVGYLVIMLLGSSIIIMDLISLLEHTSWSKKVISSGLIISWSLFGVLPIIAIVVVMWLLYFRLMISLKRHSEYSMLLLKVHIVLILNMFYHIFYDTSLLKYKIII